MKTNEERQNRKELTIAKRKNAKLFPIYKMFSWDLLCFYSIQFLFYTITKGISGPDVLKISAIYPICNILWKLPAIICSDCLGRKKSIVLGNILISCYIVLIIFVPGALGIILGNIVFSFGYSLKTMQESNLLYDSVATKGGDGLFSKLNAKGGSFYYLLDGVASLLAGYLFVINQYLPMFICLGFSIISIVLSLQFKDIYQKQSLKKSSMKESLKEYKMDLKESFIAMGKSKRLRSIILFGAVFVSLITITDTYRENLLTDMKVAPEMFSIIFASMILIGGISAGLQEKIHKKFKNKTLKFLSSIYIFSVIGIGLVTWGIGESEMTYVMPIILLLFTIEHIAHSNYYLLGDRYLRNFTTPNNRARVDFAYNFMTDIASAVFGFLGGVLLEYFTTSNAFLLIGIAFLAIFIVTWDYMRKHLGLSPEKYTKEDIMI